MNLLPHKNTQQAHFPKPILKWVGGKTQIIHRLMSDVPTEINNYHEVFLGGGSVLLAILTKIQTGTIQLHGNLYAYDLNEPLIYVYKNIQTHPTELYDEIQKIIAEYNACEDGEINRTPKNKKEAQTSKENYYYWTRTEYNRLLSAEKNTLKGSALFIFLNKTCFRGLFRMGPNGFNVPYGHYKNPEIINREHLHSIHRLIQPVVFECCDFNTSLQRAESGDFVYLDPPYVPETCTSFVGYTENGFHNEQHTQLFRQVHYLTKQGVKILLSNADVPTIRKNFTSEKYNITAVQCKRAIHSKNPNSTAVEVLIKNY